MEKDIRNNIQYGSIVDSFLSQDPKLYWSLDLQRNIILSILDHENKLTQDRFDHIYGEIVSFHIGKDTYSTMNYREFGIAPPDFIPLDYMIFGAPANQNSWMMLLFKMVESGEVIRSGKNGSYIYSLNFKECFNRKIPELMGDEG